MDPWLVGLVGLAGLTPIACLALGYALGLHVRGLEEERDDATEALDRALAALERTRVDDTIATNAAHDRTAALAAGTARSRLSILANGARRLAREAPETSSPTGDKPRDVGGE